MSDRKGMFLRSGSAWHIDPVGVDTLEAFLKTKDLTPEEVDPIPVDVFVEYVRSKRHVPAVGIRLAYRSRRGRHPGGFSQNEGSNPGRSRSHPGRRLCRVCQIEKACSCGRDPPGISIPSGSTPWRLFSKRRI